MSAKIGTILNNRYRLDAELGQGGMGVVYHAHDTLLDRSVALKVLNKANLGAEGKMRLLHEARAVARLNHPHIVSVYDASQADDLPFIVMELIQGKSLFEYMAQDLDQVMVIGQQICDALDHAHSNGIVHRDLKPENVIIAADGSIKLTDFGLALSVASRLSTEGTTGGTVFYLAPEIVLGELVDGRTDLYALGVMLYELTTGQLPFTADDPLAVISQHLYAPVVPPQSLKPDIPLALDALIVQLLNKQPKDRPQSALQVHEALENLALQPAGAHFGLLDSIARGRLVGRKHELAQISALWGRTASVPGEGHVLLVSGEPGIGKTRLVRELMTKAAVSGGLVLMGECYAEGGAPYAPFSQMIQDASEKAVEISANLPDFVLADLITIAPVLRARFPGVPPNPPLDPQAEQQRVFESIIVACVALAERAPVLLFVDDAQWADSDTLFLLRHLARRTRKQRVLMVLTYREIELSDANPLQNVLYDFNRERLSTRIKLTRLDREQTRNMLAAMLSTQDQVAEELVDAIYHETEGNPFFIEEVCKVLVEEEKLVRQDGYWVTVDVQAIRIPQSVRATIQSRLTKLPSPAQDVLRIASVLGREFDFDILKQASDLDKDALIDALESAEHAQIINKVRRARMTATTFAFAHTLIPTTLREGMSSLRRHRLHRHVAEAIEALHPNDFETLAYHYAQAGDIEYAHRFYARAGQRALKVYANQEAERYYNAALELSTTDVERAPLLAGLGQVRFRQTRYELAEQTWVEAIRLYQTIQDHDNIARLYSRAARAAWYTGNAPRGLELCREGLAVAPKALETPGIATLIHETARAYYFNDLPDDAMPLCQQALEMAQSLDLIEVQADTLATLGLLPTLSPQERKQTLAQAVELAEAAGFLFIASRARMNLAGHLLDMDEYLPAIGQYGRARELARQMGTPAWEYTYANMEANNLLRVGDLSGAERALADLDVLQASTAIPDADVLWSQMIEARLMQLQGHWEKALKMLHVVKEQVDQIEHQKCHKGVPFSLAEAFFELGNWDQAERILNDIEMHKDKSVKPAMLGVIYVAQGRVEQAEKMLVQLREQVGSEPRARHERLVCWLEARLAVAQGRWAQAWAAFQRMAELAEELHLRWRLARALQDWAEAHLQRGEVEDASRAQALLGRALGIYEQLPAPGYVARVRERLAGITAHHHRQV